MSSYRGRAPRRSLIGCRFSRCRRGNNDDKARKLNRTENLRPIAATDPDFDRLYPRRNDAESINRDLDDTLYLRRAHRLGHARQHLNLLGYALVTNAVTLHRYGKHREPDTLAA